ncbi:TetR/AcrR family transcriptional regulator [Agarivorans gilvus]|uniref:TetR family transcriptional regulator n=1 Tax=Agarivorans gilvus TaxID=680279 RepID=A0ABQ1I6E6_9ALTE|nr:TetR/AcrR family transcriptional regulator [Agarivorans gilvus]GGB21279.1 TetR family transcriptional regulator [Agarivorans gilvus]
MTKGRKSKREHLVEAAQQLFYREGIKGTGIDAVLEHAGISKRTLYNHFKSKDELVIATLQRRDDEFLNMIKTGVNKFASQQQGNALFAKPLAFFDAIEEWTKSPQFSGCMFINASAEYPRQDHPVHVICTMHKRLVIQYLEELLEPLQLANKHDLALQFAVLADGAIVNAHTTSNKNAAQVAKQIALSLLELHCP